MANSQKRSVVAGYRGAAPGSPCIWCNGTGKTPPNTVPCTGPVISGDNPFEPVCDSGWKLKPYDAQKT